MTLWGAWVELPWGRMRVWQAGSGPVVVAIHGLGGSGRYWTSLAQLLGATHTVVAPDLAGFDQSDKPSSTYDREFHLDNLDALVDAVSPASQVIVVGHSVGATLAALWAARRPEKIAALALVAAPFPGLHSLPAPAQWVRERPRSRSRRIPIALLRWTALLMAAPVALARGYPAAIVRDYARQSLQGRLGTMWTLMADPEAADELVSLRELPPDARALLFNASSDRWAASEDAMRWLDVLPHAERLGWQGGHQLLLRGGSVQLAQWIRSTGR